MMYVLKEYRLKRNYSCETMARKLGISKTYYWQIEQGKRRITYDMALKLSDIFNTTPDTLLYEDTLRNILCKESAQSALLLDK